MSTNILFVFEGERTENLVVKSLEKFVLSGNIIIKCAFSADIYQLYREIDEDEDLDIFNLIKERNIGNIKMLEKYHRNDFAEIYLFFDNDAHASLDEKIKDMLAFFNNETDKGKLYISYPMVEAIRHIIDYEGFQFLKVKCKGKNCPYREVCDEKEACEKEHHYKQYSFPEDIVSQLDIFINQFDKYIYPKCPMVAVLSAFPIFVFDYYGHEKTKLWLECPIK